MTAPAVAGYGLALLASPLLPGIVRGTCAWASGRGEAPLLELYRDLGRALRAGPRHATPLRPGERLGAGVALVALLLVLLAIPLGPPAMVGFAADFVVVLALLVLARVSLELPRLEDAASPGAGLLPGVLSEAALLIVLLVVVRATGHISLSTMAHAAGSVRTLPLILASVALFLLLSGGGDAMRLAAPAAARAEPGTDEPSPSPGPGRDRALSAYGAALRLWALGALLADLAVPATPATPWLRTGAVLGAIVVTAAGVGLLQAMLRRLRLGSPWLPVLAGTGLALCALTLALSA